MREKMLAIADSLEEWMTYGGRNRIEYYKTHEEVFQILIDIIREEPQEDTETISELCERKT